MSEPISIKITSTLDMAALSRIFCAITLSLRDLFTSYCQTLPQVIVEKPVAVKFSDENAKVVVNLSFANEPSISTSRSIPKVTHLPENASQLLRYYGKNKHYDSWPSLHEFSEYLHDVKKVRVHNSFKKEIETLMGLFSKDHPAQLRLAQLENQLKASCMLSYWVDPHLYTSSYFVNPRGIFVSDLVKRRSKKSFKKKIQMNFKSIFDEEVENLLENISRFGMLTSVFSWCKACPCEARCFLVRRGASSSPKTQQAPRNMKKIHRRKVAQLTDFLTKKDFVKEELEIAQDALILGGYRRIDHHYNDFHEASRQL
ncbi:16347_t:CDS:10, partial [Funneliformis caledonium]